ncbi:MAG: hypothetical protein OXI95_17955 [bacterium]|nr:hypothetical protein [bacterium]
MTEGMCFIGPAAPKSPSSFAADGDCVVMAAASQDVETTFDIQPQGLGLNIRKDAHGQIHCCVGFDSGSCHGETGESCSGSSEFHDTADAEADGGRFAPVRGRRRRQGCLAWCGKAGRAIARVKPTPRFELCAP